MEEHFKLEKPFVNSAPARLYAMQLKLRPLERGGSLMPFSGELVHGAWLHWMRNAAPDISSWLHDGNKRRLFTCSSLQFPIPLAARLKAERENRHLALDPQKTYTIRITLLLGELFPLFYQTLLGAQQNGGASPGFQIGRQQFVLDHIILDASDASDWSGVRAFQDMVDDASRLTLGKASLLELEFTSLTTFNWLYLPNKLYGNHYARLPLPQYIFQGLANRWQELAPSELAGVIQRDRIEAYVQAEGIVIDDYNLQTHQVQFAAHPQRGFIGTCKYLLRGPDAPPADDSPLTIRQQIYLLSQLAFYTGIGYKPAMGMGQSRALP